MSSQSRASTFLHPASGALILGADWLLFAENAVTFGLSTPLLALVGFCVGGVGVGLIQRRYQGDGMGTTLLKGLFAGLTVGLPFPVAGTAVGGGILALSGLNQLWSRSDADKMSPPSPRPDQ